MGAAIRFLWNDPVMAGLISAGLLALATYLFVRVQRRVVRWRGIRTVVFVSSGGTCRDPMAKAILEHLVSGRTLKHPLRIEAAGIGPLSSTEVSFAAAHAIREMYGEDLLKGQQPNLLTPELAREADLILVMDRSLMQKTLPKDKTYVFKEFFGLSGDIKDPYPDGRDAETLRRYREVAEEMRDVLESNLDRLLGALGL